MKFSILDSRSGARAGGAALLVLCCVLYLPVAGAQMQRPQRPEVWAESLVTENEPYVQQTVIYTLRIHHRGGIDTLDPEPFNVTGLSIVKIDGPITNKEWVGNKRGYHSDFRYGLTPLKSGEYQVPANTILVKRNEQQEQRTTVYGTWQTPKLPKEFTIVAPPLDLHSKPPATEEYPWLPLYGLSIEGEYDKRQRPQVGEPLSLTLVQTAWGAGGDQLPPLATYLEGADFKVYADRPETDRSVSESGKILEGRRSETFTLIPRHAGRLVVPVVKLPWWNLAQDKQDWAEWPGLIISVAPPEGYVEAPPEIPELEPPAQPSQVLSGLWMLLVGAVSFFLGWWIRAGRPGPAHLLRILRDHAERSRQRRGKAKAARASAAAGKGKPGEKAAKAPKRPPFSAVRKRLARVHPAILRRRVRKHVEAVTPRWVHIRSLRRRIETASTPQEVEHHLQAYAHDILGLRANASLMDIAHAMVRAYPDVKGDVIIDRIRRLDAAIYGPVPEDFGFRRWLRSFRRVMRAIGNREPEFVRRPPDRGLPALNPSRR